MDSFLQLLFWGPNTLFDEKNVAKNFSETVYLKILKILLIDASPLLNHNLTKMRIFC